VPLHAHTALPVDIPLPSVEFFNQARLFLGICRQIPYAISEDMSKVSKHVSMLFLTKISSLWRSNLSHSDREPLPQANPR